MITFRVSNLRLHSFFFDYLRKNVDVYKIMRAWSNVCFILFLRKTQTNSGLNDCNAFDKHSNWYKLIYFSCLFSESSRNLSL